MDDFGNHISSEVALRNTQMKCRSRMSQSALTSALNECSSYNENSHQNSALIVSSQLSSTQIGKNFIRFYKWNRLNWLKDFADALFLKARPNTIMDSFKMFSATFMIRYRNEFGIIRVYRSNNMVPMVLMYLAGANIESFFASAMRLLNSGLSFNNIATIISAQIASINLVNDSERSTNMPTVNRHTSSLSGTFTKKKLEMRTASRSETSISQQLNHHQDIEESHNNMNARLDVMMEDIIIRLNRLHLTDNENVKYSFLYTY